MLIVGLTGGIGSGKSMVAHMFAELGVPVVDTDRIAHELTAPGRPLLQEVAGLLGNDVIDAGGALDRNLVRQRVFADPDLRKQLEAILHPRIRARAVELLERNPAAPYQILVVPLLFETQGYQGIVGRTLVVDCEERLQVRRAMARSHLGEADVRAIMAAQMSRDQRLALADDVIENNGSLDALAEQVGQKHKKYINTCIVSQSIS